MITTSKNFNNWFSKRPKSYVNSTPEKNVLKFDMGECLLSKNSVPYPDPSQTELRQKIASQCGVGIENIVLGCGSDEIIENIPRIFLDSGDTALTIAPTFFRFEDATLRVGAKLFLIKTRNQDNFAVTDVTVREIVNKVKNNKVKLVWLCSPNNPTGLFIKPEQIIKILKNCHCLVVIDEVFLGATQWQNENTKLISKFDNLVLIRSLSKITGVAGTRIGVGLANPKLIKNLNDWRLPFNIPQTSLETASKVLNNLDFEKSIIKIIAKERQWLFEKIQKFHNLELGAASQSNVFILRHKKLNLFDELLKRNILTANLNLTEGMKGQNFVRITIQNHQNNKVLINALREINNL